MSARGGGFGACFSSDEMAGCRNNHDTMIRARVAGSRSCQAVRAGQ
jgi:hypothetical protein